MIVAREDAKELVSRAKAQGMDIATIAKVCNVDPSSVFRWQKEGRGAAAHLDKLEAALSHKVINSGEILGTGEEGLSALMTQYAILAEKLHTHGFELSLRKI